MPTGVGRALGVLVGVVADMEDLVGWQSERFLNVPEYSWVRFFVTDFAGDEDFFHQVGDSHFLKHLAETAVGIAQNGQSVAPEPQFFQNRQGVIGQLPAAGGGESVV